MSGSISLFCIIHGEQDATPFSVRVKKANTIDELKDLIDLVSITFVCLTSRCCFPSSRPLKPADADRVKASD